METVDEAPLLVARDARTIEHVLVACAAAGCEAQLVRDPEQVRSRWAQAPLVLVGGEMAAQVAALGLGARPGVHLVGDELGELAAWSAPLDAAVLQLPQQTSLLTSLLGRRHDQVGGATVVAVSGGSGGVGATTLACSLAQVGSARGLRPAVVELDPLGGGIDLLFGAETAEGWRWPELVGATGHVDDLSSRVVDVSGVQLVSAGRQVLVPPAEAVRAVVASLSRTHDLVVLDCGSSTTGLPAGSFPGLVHLLVVAADVRSVMAARARVEAAGWRQLELVVRRGAGRRLDPELVARSLGLPLLATVSDDRAVQRAAEVGEPPGRGRGRHVRRLQGLLDEVAA